MDWKSLNPRIIAEFRANDGKVAHFGDLPMVILHARSARTGKFREIPLVAIIEGGDTLIFASNAGSPEHPSWYHDLKAEPRIDVELGTERFLAEIVELSEAESEGHRDRQARAAAAFANYVTSAAPRVIPVFSIRRL